MKLKYTFPVSKFLKRWFCVMMRHSITHVHTEYMYTVWVQNLFWQFFQSMCTMYFWIDLYLWASSAGCVSTASVNWMRGVQTVDNETVLISFPVYLVLKSEYHTSLVPRWHNLIQLYTWAVLTLHLGTRSQGSFVTWQALVYQAGVTSELYLAVNFL
jgi:hypothetical protein